MLCMVSLDGSSRLIDTCPLAVDLLAVDNIEEAEWGMSYGSLRRPASQR